MTRGTKQKETSASAENAFVRAIISFPPALYVPLEDIARQRTVSLAWIVREASGQYIVDESPLLEPRKGA